MSQQMIFVRLKYVFIGKEVVLTLMVTHKWKKLYIVHIFQNRGNFSSIFENLPDPSLISRSYIQKYNLSDPYRFWCQYVKLLKMQTHGQDEATI